MLKTNATDPALANPLALRRDDNFGRWREQRFDHQGAVIYPACLARSIFFRCIPV
ncbi:hypothetical protein [Komagataeibacter oboediens]|uniref:Uncharacterized protein n=1 Tax=Komagataeibacter oboediens TaxID=65958 RepID=A0ABS5STE8_9PROT|nr:hypothetical protein [Komagataeibacter oboediens]MBT0677020.1 hypothetical protein [Komagataeibacter oboediens]MBT0680348.1 hypothetical protein [Komagataeibacter oboediens]GBQ52746.1 hypothetical protein AA15973_2876 [Komagataeibacter sucrofermentans DSM 15973]